MPPLSRRAKPLLSTVGGKPSSADQPATKSSAAAITPPSSAPKPAPLREGMGLSDDPESGSSNDEGSDDDKVDFASSALSSPVSKSPYKPPRRGKALRAPRSLGGGRATTVAANKKRARGNEDAATGTQDSEVGSGHDDDMMDPLFGDMSTSRPAKHRRTTYGTAGRSFEAPAASGKAKKAAAGYGGRSGAKSAQSTPAKNIHTLAKTSAASTGRAAAKTNKKGTPFSDISANTVTLSSSQRIHGECAGGENEGRRPGKMLKLLDPMASPPSPERAILKTLPPVNFPIQTRSSPKLLKLAPSQPQPSPAECTQGSTSLSKSQDYEVIDLTKRSKDIKLGKSDASNKGNQDTPTNRKTLKLLPSIDGGTPSTPYSKKTATRRSSRRNKGQAADHDDDDKDIKVSSPIGLDALEDDDDDGPNPNGNYETPAKCPICQAPVDRFLLEEWQGSRAYMRIRRQMAFCQAHRRATAREEYAAREYPEIDFDALLGTTSAPRDENGEDDDDDEGGDDNKNNNNKNNSSGSGRIQRFRDDLIGIVRRERASAFRDAADAAASRGEGRSLRKTVLATTTDTDAACLAGGMSVGYYGPRGRRVMEGWVTRELADAIRQQAGRDRLIGFKTVSGFIQEVLVPELATRLVAEDLDVGEERAREVLRESGEIGELVNGVDDEDGEEEGGGGGGERTGAGKLGGGEDEDGEGDY
ncbi:uncharacterized protein BKCO1_35000111 [Diplodia corticola]|uniref:Restriction of telomere capping protein 4 n=1 Tax=Diplodia corticola TaxID=236234 RepID=A0A1J9QV21_9PEZI|nr:uncharacterized protein BKCO1_35000111 [Diplodia corticola]OJD32838.1 hypothetical protein BKCO1_35000111 [Diplodia corticola]